MRNVKHITHDFDELNLRKEAETFDNWNKYTDPRYPDGENSPFEVVYWNEDLQNIPIAYKEGYKFLEKYDLLSYDWTILYHKLLADSILIPHTDHGCVAAVNCILNDDDMNYLMYKKANLSPITDWDFYTCDINNSTTFSWDDIYFGYTLWSQGHLHNKYVFTPSEKTTIESNPTTNYYNTYFPNQVRTIDNQNQFYIMGTGKHKTTINSNTIQ